MQIYYLNNFIPESENYKEPKGILLIQNPNEVEDTEKKENKNGIAKISERKSSIFSGTSISGTIRGDIYILHSARTILQLYPFMQGHIVLNRYSLKILMLPEQKLKRH